MCGLVGVAGDIGKAEKDAFRMLLHLDIVRGPHSTGVASVDTAGNWSLAKKKGTAWDLFDSKEYNSLMTSVSYCLMGHNRYATKGKVNNINAHPFEFEDVVGAHNGTITHQSKLPNHTAFEVDSENIFYSIQQQGIEATLEVLAGAYALTYWDKRDEELVMVRNDERELYYCFNMDRSAVFWASESWMLWAALTRAGVKFKQPVLLPECEIHRFKFERRYASKQPITFTYQPYEECIPPKAVTTGGYSNGYSAHRGSKGSNLAGKPTTSTVDDPILNKRATFLIDGVATAKSGQRYISATLTHDEKTEARIYCEANKDLWAELQGSVGELFSGVLNRKAFEGNFTSFYYSVNINSVECEEDAEEKEEKKDLETLLACGCLVCGVNTHKDQAETVRWITDEEYACNECKDLPFVEEYAQVV